MSRQLPIFSLKKMLLPLLVALVLFLSGAHHWLNFWGLGLKHMALYALPCIFLLLLITWSIYRSIRLPVIPGWKWGLFVLLAISVGGYAAWRMHEPVIAWHHLQLSPVDGIVRVLEIKTTDGVAEFDGIDLPSTWSVENGLLVGQPGQPFEYAFFGPVAAPVTVLLETGENAGGVEIILDGAVYHVDLADDQSGQRNKEMISRYRGLPVWLTTLILAGLDLAAVAFGILLLLLIQTWAAEKSPLIKDVNTNGGWRRHLPGLAVIMALAVVLHTISILSVPLWLDVDSSSYLVGAVGWLRDGDWASVSAQRGLGTTLLFTPVMALFGRDPWGMKVLLHLFGLGCVPLLYAIGWLLSHRRSFAFASGLLAVLTPDLMFYSNYLMSDLPHIFIVLLVVCCLILALQTRRWCWIAATLLICSFAVLLRPENTLLLAVCTGFLILQAVVDASRVHTWRAFPGFAWRLALLLLAAIAPLLGWSLRNYRQYGVFELSNNAGEILYNWVTFGEGIGQPIADHDSPAVQTILRAYQRQRSPALPEAGNHAGDTLTTGTWNDFNTLIMDGHTRLEAFDILRRATIDSVRKDPLSTLKLLSVKVSEGLEPAMTAINSYPLAGEDYTTGLYKGRYFDDERVHMPELILLQRRVYDIDRWFYSNIWGVGMVLRGCHAAGRFTKAIFYMGTIIGNRPVEIHIPFDAGVRYVAIRPGRSFTDGAAWAGVVFCPV